LHTADPVPIITTADRLGLTLFFAIVAHAVVVLGVTFAPTEKDPTRSSTLDIILVQRSSDKTPEDADYLAQASQEGGGESEAKERPATPTPTPFVSRSPRAITAALPVAPAPVPAAEKPKPKPSPPKPEPRPPAPKPVLSQKEVRTPLKVAPKPPPKPTPPEEPKPAPKTPPRPPAESRPTKSLNAATLIRRSRAIASLSAEIDQKLQAYAKRPRRKWISAKTREYKYASYMEAWRRKVEKIGNLNYPDEARRRKLSGSLLLDVSLNPDGSVGDITLRKSSGHKALDDAAIRIVRLAAPFAALPKNIRKDTDILHIERTWQFLSSNRLAAR